MTILIPYRNGQIRAPELSLWDPRRTFDELMPFDIGPQVYESEDMVTVTVDMPGMDAEDIEVTLNRGVLHIEGRRAYRTHSAFATVGTGIDVDHVTTNLEHGVLTIHAPKLPSARPRRIEVRATSRNRRHDATSERGSWWRRLLGRS